MNSIVLCGVVALLALQMDVTTSTSFINFGAFLAFSLVNLSVVFHYYLGAERRVHGKPCCSWYSLASAWSPTCG